MRPHINRFRNNADHRTRLTELVIGDRPQHFLDNGPIEELRNIACRVVEVRDATDRVLPGRGLEDSDTFTGDSVRHTVTWQGDANLPLPKDADSGTVYTRFIPHRQLRFVMRNAELYSFTIERSGN